MVDISVIYRCNIGNWYIVHLKTIRNKEKQCIKK